MRAGPFTATHECREGDEKPAELGSVEADAGCDQTETKPIRASHAAEKPKYGLGLASLLPAVGQRLHAWLDAHSDPSTDSCAAARHTHAGTAYARAFTHGLS